MIVHVHYLPSNAEERIAELNRLRSEGNRIHGEPQQDVDGDWFVCILQREL